MQRGEDAESRFFQSFADDGHYRGAGGSRQGIYVVTPGGKLLASANELNAERLCTMLRETLSTWDGMSSAERGGSEAIGAASGRRWEDSCPTDGLVLIETFRDVPQDFEAGATAILPSNRDHVWFSADEARAFAKSEPGAQAAFVRRLARFHFVDSVRGQSLPFADEELERLELIVTITDGAEGELSFKLSGSTIADAKGPWLMGQSEWTPNREFPRSVSVDFSGHAVWNEVLGVFTEFELIAIGTRRGQTQINGRAKDMGPAPIGFHFALSTGGVRIPPAFVLVYDADWIAPLSN